MRAWFFDRYGKTTPFRMGEALVPQAAKGQVVVVVHACALNVLDLKVRDGALKAVLPHALPLTPGYDLAGIIESCGPGVSGWKVGDAVIACTGARNPGALAERVAIDAALLAPAPRGTDMADAAGLPVAALTAWQALVELGNIGPDAKVFVEAGSGGVGTLAIQLAKHLGAYVATTCSAGNADLVRSLGADQIIDYRSQDYGAMLSDFDLVLHSQDAASLDKGLRILKSGGLLVSINGTPDIEFARDYGQNLLFRVILRAIGIGIRHRARRLGVRYRFLFMRADGAQLTEISRLVSEGVLRPVTDSRFPFDKAEKALARLASGRARGKIVVESSAM